MFPPGSGRSAAGVDLLTALEDTAKSNPSGSSASFLKDIMNPLPEEIAVTIEDLERGMEFFVKNSVGITQSLMHFSLAGGFARYV